MKKEIIELYDYNTHLTDERRCQIAETMEIMQSVIQKCFDDICKPDGNISKETALILMRHADRTA